MTLGRPSPGVWTMLFDILMVGAFIQVSAVNPRLAVGILALAVSLVLLHIGFDAVAYGIVTVTVVLVDGWAPTRSAEETPFLLGIGRLHLLEIPIYLLFLAYLTRRRNPKNPKSFEGIFVSTPLDLPLYGWLIAFPVFALYGLVLGHPLQDAIGYGEWRCLFIAILFYFLVTSVFRGYKGLRQLWRWFFLFASVKALYSLVLFITKIDPPLPLVFGQGPVGECPENAMYLFAALPAMAILLFRAEKDREWRAVLAFGALIMVADVALSQKRSPQLALFVGLVVLAWLLPSRERIRCGLGIACFTLLIALGGALANRGSNDSAIGASLSRYNEIIGFVQGAGEKASAGDDTLEFHMFDVIDGWETIKKHPLLGQGFGGQTERNLTAGAPILTGMIHDQYLTFWLKMGIAGPILMLWLIGKFLFYCRRKLNRVSHKFASATVIGICAAICADVAIELWGADWIGNTKTPVVIFLSMALAIGFLRCCTEDTRSAWRSERSRSPSLFNHSMRKG